MQGTLYSIHPQALGNVHAERSLDQHRRQVDRRPVDQEPHQALQPQTSGEQLFHFDILCVARRVLMGSL